MKKRKHTRKMASALLASVSAAAVALGPIGLPGLLPASMDSMQMLTAYAEGQAVETYSVTISGGKMSTSKTSGTVQVSKLVTVKANTAPTGKKFSHWERNGVKVSTNSTYSFYMPGYDISLEAVFVADTSAVTNAGTAIIESVTPNKSTGKVSFVSLLNVPKDCTYVKGGLVATSNSSIGANVDASNATYVKLSTKGTSKTKNLKYTWTKGNVTEKTVWYVKGYLVYKDSTGVEKTVYSDCVAANINGIVQQTAQENGVFLDKETNTLTIRGAVTDTDIKNFDYGDDYSPQSVKKIYAEKGSSLTGNMDSIFRRCYCAEEIDLSNLDTSGITNMDHMFAYLANVKKINLHGIDTSNVTNMHWMFYACDNLEEVDVTGLDTSKVTDMEYLFTYNYKLTKINLNDWDLSSVKTIFNAFYDCDSLTSIDLSKSDMSNLENAGFVFGNCNNLKSVKFGNATTSKLENMNSMFYACPELTDVDIKTLNTSKVTNYAWLFGDCPKLETVDLSGLDTSKAQDMNNMFYNCTSLTSIDVSGFDTSNVKHLSGIFQNCSSLESVDVSGFNTSKAISLARIFKGCTKLTSIDVSVFDTSNVLDMYAMFQNCSSLSSLDVSGFNTAKVTDMGYMFSGCTVLPYVDLGSFNYSKITEYENYSTMFDGSPYLLANVVSAYRTELTNGYNANLRVYITVNANAAKAVVSIGDQSQEFSRDDWNLSSGTLGTINFSFKSNATTSSDKFKIRFYDAEDRPLPVIGDSNEYCNNAEFTRDSRDVTRTYFRVTKVVGDESSYTEYNTSNKSITLDKYFLGSSTVPEGYKLYGWEVNGTVYPLSQNYSYWTGGKDTTITAVFAEKSAREKIPLSLDSPETVHYEDGDSDTLSFTAETAGTYIFTSDGAHRMIGYLYSDADMKKLIASDAYSVTNSDFRIKVDLAAGQTVYMKNSEYYGVTDIYDYTVKVRKQREYPVRFESLVLDTTANGKYVDIDEYDVFAFTPSEDGVYLFKAENTEAGITGALYDDEMLDNCIAGKDENSETVTVRAVLTAGQTVYFKPARDNVYYSCDYKVSVTKKEVTVSEPVEITLGTAEEGSYTDPDEFDRFVFTASETGTYRFKVENDDDTGMYTVWYEDSAFSNVIRRKDSIYSSNGQKCTFSFNMTEGQTVYFAPKAYNEDNNFNYSVIVEQTYPTPLTLDQYTAGHFADSDDYDYFSFTAPGDGDYSFTGNSDYAITPVLYSNSDLTGYIKSGDYSWGDNGTKFSVGISLSAGQTVYLKPVSADSDNQNFDFDVYVKHLNVGLKTLTLNTPTAGHFEGNGAFDYFSFTAEEAGTYYFASECDTDTQGYLYSDAALTNQIAYDDDSNGNYQFKIIYTLEAGQTVYLKPVEYGQDASCDYTVTVTLKQATPLVLDTAAAGRYEDSENYDCFSFTATEAETYVFTSSSAYNIEGYLFSDSALSEELAYDDNSNGNRQFKIIYTLEAGQTVYLKPVNYFEDDSCDYTVNVSKSAYGLSSLTLDTVTAGHFDSSDEYDFFAFTAEEEGCYVFTVQADSYISPELYNDANMTKSIKIGGSYYSGDSEIFVVAIRLSAGEKVYLKPAADSSDTDYTVTVEKKNIGLKSLSLNTATAGKYVDEEIFDYFSFKATEAGTYVFTSECENDTNACLYSDAALTDFLTGDDDGGDDMQFKIEYELEEGQTVYLKPSGGFNYTVTVTKT